MKARNKTIIRKLLILFFIVGLFVMSIVSVKASANDYALYLTDKAISRSADHELILASDVTASSTATTSTSASDTEEAEITQKPVLDQKEILLKPGKKQRLHVENADGLKITWTSQNPEIATVSKKGKVTAVATGKTYIIASYQAPRDPSNPNSRLKTYKLKCKVKVKNPVTIKIAGIGDLLMHDRVIAFGKQSDGTYNYDGIFKQTTDYFKNFDVVIANQETPFTDNPAKYQGYPTFGTPTALGDAMIKAGINVVMSASNHSWDQGTNGIKVTTNYWKEHKDQVVHLGMAYTEEEFKTIVYKKYKGIKIAFINFTNFLNDYSGMKKYYVNVLNAYKYNDYGNSFGSISEDRLMKDIAKASEKADFVIVLPHWGTEYTHTPTSAQKNLAQKMAEAGADAIIGTHAHVVMPMKILETSDGRRVPCYYSTGNFVSNMGQAARNLEGIAELTLIKWNGTTTITNAEFTPIINHIDKTDTKFCVYLLSEYPEDVAKDHISNSSRYGGAGTLTPKTMQKLFDSIGNDKW
ncbi:MAG: CapA family protein [Lachnospiraceae bacterium]|nr:CapA family protein [Lachnospiraceae bacterium]